MVVKAADGITHTFKIYVSHRFPIPEDTYTLLGDDSYSSYQWAVGRRLARSEIREGVGGHDGQPYEACERLTNLSLQQELAMYLSDLTTGRERSSQS